MEEATREDCGECEERSKDGSPHDHGAAMYLLARELFPICRSITGNGVRQTLNILRREVPNLQIHEVASGTRAFDWTVPDEWNIRDAYIATEDGQRVVDFQKNNLHVVGYSVPVDCVMDLEELQGHLHSLEQQPDAIPYVTSYYQRRWGFCLSHKQRLSLASGRYRVVIDTSLEPGSLTYGELRLPGESNQEVFVSTYVCHPSMANNELSGPLVATWLAKYVATLPRRRYSYRFVFIPETIGSIVYLSRHLKHLQQNMVAGFVITCVGDDRAYSLLPSRLGGTLADRVALQVMKNHAPEYTHYSFLERGSDERQYCSATVDLPVVSIMRSKYGTYPEYHTSLDNLELISPAGMSGALDIYQKCIELLEANRTYRAAMACEPQMGRRGLYPTLSCKDNKSHVRTMMDLLAYVDGNHDLIQIAERINAPAIELIPIARCLLREGVLESVEDV